MVNAPVVALPPTIGALMVTAVAAVAAPLEIDLVPPVLLTTIRVTAWVNPLRSRLALLPSPWPSVRTVAVGKTLFAPMRMVPTAIWVLPQVLPVELMTQVLPSVLARLADPRLMVLVMTPVAVPRKNRVPVKLLPVIGPDTVKVPALE